MEWESATLKVFTMYRKKKKYEEPRLAITTIVGGSIICASTITANSAEDANVIEENENDKTGWY